MFISTKYDMWQLVYLVTDEDQVPRMITGIKYMGDTIMYQLSAGSQYSDHYEPEISETADVLKGLQSKNT